MGELGGFLRYRREGPPRRSVPLRVRDWREVYEPFPPERLQVQAARCMDCGIPFCHEGCPLGNLIPDWNDLVYREDWAAAMDRLHATNNFPEMTGRLCPAPCEEACVLGINSQPVTIKQVELGIVERAFSEGGVRPRPAASSTGRRVAVVGSGPAGLAAAQQLARAGHSVVVYERGERPGGLLRYGIPEFKMEKAVLDRRLEQLAAEGVEFRCRTVVGRPPGWSGSGASGPDGAGPGGAGASWTAEPLAAPADASVVGGAALRTEHDALVLAGGATLPRDLDIPGRHLAGIHTAMAFLKPANLVQEKSSSVAPAEQWGALEESPISAQGKRVVIVGGGDTGADCLGTVHRQGAVSVHQLEIMPQPPELRPESNPWPTWPTILRTSAAHEEGGERLFSVTATQFLDDGRGAVAALALHQVELVMEGGRPSFVPVAGSQSVLECELVLLAMGFLGPERAGLVEELGLELDARGNVARDEAWATNLEGVFVCGDMGRGQSLIVWAIAEGRAAAASVDRALMGDSPLPAPVKPTQMALR